MIGDPLIHLRDMRCRSVRTKKLLPVLDSSLRHEFSLPFYGAPTPCNTDVRTWKLSLDRCHERVYGRGMRTCLCWMPDCQDVMWDRCVGVWFVNWLGANGCHLLPTPFRQASYYIVAKHSISVPFVLTGSFLFSPLEEPTFPEAQCRFRPNAILSVKAFSFVVIYSARASVEISPREGLAESQNGVPSHQDREI